MTEAEKALLDWAMSEEASLVDRKLDELRNAVREERIPPGLREERERLLAAYEEARRAYQGVHRQIYGEPDRTLGGALTKPTRGNQ